MSRFSRMMAVCAATACAASMVALGSATAAGAGTHAASNAAAARAAAFAVLRTITLHQPQTDQRLPGSMRADGLHTFHSSNWSGYADDNTKKNTYSKVSAAWTEPAITCPSKEFQWAVFWVGIDGLTSKTVEQDGSTAECYEGKAYYATWWEMYPTNGIQVVGTTVKPGDKITASVVKSGTSYALTVTDATTKGNNISKNETCAASKCVDSSAEWIAETPGTARGDTPLPDFRTWSVSAASVTSGTKTGTVSTFPDDAITMESVAGYALASPGSLNSAGNAFSVTWDNSN